MPKKFANSSATGELGYNFVERIILQAGCKAVGYPGAKDTGLDGHIEFVVDEGVTGKLVGFQVKRGKTYWRNEAPFVQTKRTELEYWFDHALPVIVIVVAPDGGAAYWMDVKAHIEANPSVLESGPYTLYPPLEQRFDESTLMTRIMRLASKPDFGTVVRNLSSSQEEDRVSGIETALAFRAERRACFVLVAALAFESSQEIIRTICAILSRFLPHPEASYSDIPADVRSYLVSLLTEVPDEILYRILDSFDSDDFSFTGPGVEEIFQISAEEVWVPQDVFQRGSIEQSMAVVTQCIGQGRFARMIRDTSLEPAIRCGAVVFYANSHEEGLDAQTVRDLIDGADDRSLRAWLTWLLFWITHE